MIAISEKATLFLAHLSMNSTHNGLLILSVIMDDKRAVDAQRLLEHIEARRFKRSTNDMMDQHKEFLAFAKEVGVDGLLDYDLSLGKKPSNTTIIEAIPEVYLSFELVQCMRDLFLATEKHQKLKIARRMTIASTRILQDPSPHPCDVICVAALMDCMLSFISNQGADTPWLVTKYPASQEYADYSEVYVQAIDRSH